MDSNEKLSQDVGKLGKTVDSLADTVGVLSKDVGTLGETVGVLSKDVSRLTVLVEKMGDDIKMIAEGHSILERKMDEKFGEVMAEISDLKSGQSQVLDYLARIEEDIQDLRKDLEQNYEKKGWDAEWRKQIEEKLERIEKSLERKDILIARDK